MLVGQGNGTYGPQSTSSLGIIAGDSFLIDDGTEIRTKDGEAIRASHFTASSSDATSTLPRLAVTAAFDFLGTLITDVATWFAGLFDTNFAAKDTDDLAEGGNLYFTEERARAVISETVAGLEYATSTGILSQTSGYGIPLTASSTAWSSFFDGPSTRIAVSGNLTWSGNTLGIASGFVIPRAASTTEWATAFGWGNHATQGYITNLSGFTTTDLAEGSNLYFTNDRADARIAAGTSTIRNMLAAISPITYNSGTGAIAFSNPGYITGIGWGGITGNLSDQTDLQSALNAKQNTLTTGNLTTNATGLQFDNTRTVIGGSVALSLTSGYNIPLSASTTNWNTFYNTPGSRITAGTALSWSGNTLNFVNPGYTTNTGTVTSVGLSAPTGLSVSASPVTTSGTLALSLTSGYVIPLTASTTQWAAAHASTTALTPPYIRGLFSNTATGLTYNSSTGATSLTANYDIPLTASTTHWNTFYNTPSTRITAGTGISWSGSTLNSAWTASGNNIYNNNSGNVGIGTSTPADLFHLVGTGVAGFTIQSADSQSRSTLSSGRDDTSVTTIARTDIDWYSQASGHTTIAQTRYETQGSTANQRGGVMRFFTKPDGSTGLVERFTILASGNVGIGDATPASLLTVGSGDAFQVNSSGAIVAITGVSGATGTWNLGAATVKQKTYKSFTWPGTATTTAATSSVPLGTAYTAEAWSGADCWVTSGTGAFNFGDGTNNTNGATATTTVARTTLTTNNTFTAQERRYVNIGPLTAAQFSCTVEVTVNN